MNNLGSFTGTCPTAGCYFTISVNIKLISQGSTERCRDTDLILFGKCTSIKILPATFTLKGFVVSLFCFVFYFCLNGLNFLEQSQVHSKIQQTVLRFLLFLVLPAAHPHLPLRKKELQWMQGDRNSTFPFLGLCFPGEGRRSCREPRKLHRTAASPLCTTAGTGLYVANFILLLTCLYMFV